MSRKMKLSDIKIKPSFEATVPRAYKMTECKNNYLTGGRQDRYIVINHDNELIDGYIMYLTLKELGIDEAEIIVSDTTYIYGVHPNVKYACGHSKEFVWRVPESWIGWADDLLPGDVIYADTKHGTAPVIITKIEWLNKCPVDFRVRKVISKAKNISQPALASHE